MASCDHVTTSDWGSPLRACALLLAGCQGHLGRWPKTELLSITWPPNKEDTFELLSEWEITLYWVQPLSWWVYYSRCQSLANAELSAFHYLRQQTDRLPKAFLGFFVLSWERRPLKRRKNSSTGEMGFQRNLIRPLREICSPLGPEAADTGHSSVTLWLVVKL